MLFGDPNLNDQSEVAFEKYIYLSQIYQAVCTSSQAEYYRSRAGVGGTMGALYWQLNEIWPTGGWGVIEYGRESEDGSQIIGGRWKVRNFLCELPIGDLSQCNLTRIQHYLCSL